MRLYYYTNQRFALESLRDKRLKIARFAELNDTFDNVGISITNKRQRAMLNKHRAAHNKMFGVLCMSTTRTEPLLWGHYADKHRGICLGFDVQQKDVWTRVHYQDDRISLATLGRKSLFELDASDLLQIAVTKYSAWAYEKEYRAFIKLTDADLASGLHFRPFDESMVLKEVIVGERSSATRETVTKLCEHVGGDIRAYKARASFKEFTVVEQMRASMWK